MNEFRFGSRGKRQPVYLDCRHFDGSGIGTYIGNLVRNFDSQDLEFPIEILARSEHIPQIKSFSHFKVTPYNDPIYSVREQFKWMTKIEPFGLLHVPHYNAPLIYPGKLLTTVHDVCHVAMRQFFPGMLKRLYSGQFLRRVLDRADQVITVSNFSRGEIIKYFGTREDKIRVIYNGVNPLFQPKDLDQRAKVLKKHNLPSEFLLFLGNVKPHKNITGLVESYQIALQNNPDLPPLVILGQYKNLITGIPNLRELISDHTIRSKIIFTGYLPTEDLPAIYSQALMFLFPSFYEGFGLPTLEAMACGTPVITSNCSSIPEVVEDSAILVNPYDREELASAIVKLADDSQAQQEYRKRGLEHVKKFSWASSAQEHLQIYRQVMNQREQYPAKLHPSAALPQEKKANILFLDQYGDRVGGGQIILLDILEDFRARGKWNIYISVPNEGTFTRKLKEKGFSYWCVPTWKPLPEENIFNEMNRYILSSIKSTYLLSKKVKEHGIDIVYCNGGRTFLSGSFLSFLFNLKVFWHLHLILDSRQKRVVTTFGRLPRVKRILAVSNTLEKQYDSDAIRCKITTVANWVSPDLFDLPRIKRGTEMDHPMRVGVVGQICRAKGQWTILESLDRCSRVLPIQLLIYGEPLLDERLEWDAFQQMVEKLIRKGWDVQYRGYQRDTIKIYDNLDVLAIPSIIPEAFGLTAIEAMAREVLVVSNRSGALVEIITHQENGFFYDSSNMEEFPQLMEDILGGVYDVSSIRRAGLETIRENYHPSKQLEKLHAIVHGALELPGQGQLPG